MNFLDEGEVCGKDSYLSCIDWDFDITFIVREETLEITAINRYDSDLTFCNNFTEQCLQKMGLTNKDSMSKIERLLTQARDGENEDSQLYFNIPGHDMPPAFDTTGQFADQMIIRLEWNSLIGGLHFSFPLAKVKKEDQDPGNWEHKHDILADRVIFLEREVSHLKTELENNTREIERLRRIVEGLQHNRSESIIYEGENNERFRRVEQRRRDRKNRRRGAVQLDSFPSNDFGELDFKSFSDYDYFFSESRRRQFRDKGDRRAKNRSWNSLPPSLCLGMSSSDV